MTEIGQFLILIEFGSVSQTTGPGKDGGDTVSGGLITLLVFTVMTRHSPMGSFSFYDIAGSLEH